MRPPAQSAVGLVLPIIFTSTVPCQIASSPYTWTDPETHLVWTAKDNAEDIAWKAAGRYCHKLKLGGFSDWHLPEMIEVQGIYDKRAESPGTMGIKRYDNVDAATWHIKGNIFLTGNIWTAQNPKERCLWTCYAQYFDFNEGRANSEPTGWPYPYDGMRVLCVRGSQSRTQSSSDGVRS